MAGYMLTCTGSCSVTKAKTNMDMYTEKVLLTTVELQWLEHLWDYENLFETGVVRAIEGLL